MANVSFLGLGVMGFPMAGHLAKAGHQVTVYNRTAARAQEWVAAHGGRAAPTPAEAAKGQDVVFCCVGNDERPARGDDRRRRRLPRHGAGRRLRRPHDGLGGSRARAEPGRRGRGFAFVDAPVSGGQAGAENGALTVMCGGAQKDYDRAEPLIQAYAKACRLMGPAGAGQLTKMVNQLCIAGVVQGLAEGLNFAEKSGLDLEAVVAVISKGAAQSWQMENRYKTMAADKFDFGFAVNWMRKDLAICLDEARRNGASLPLAAIVDQFYAEVQAMGGGRWDTSSLIARLKRG